MPNLHLVARRIAVAFLFLFAVATPALGDDIAKKAAVDAHISNLQGALDANRKSEAAIRDQIAALDDRIGSIESQVGTVSLHLAGLQRDLMYRRERLAELNKLFKLPSPRLADPKVQYPPSLKRLNDRLVAIYESDTPSTLDFVLGSTSIDEALDMVDFVNLIGAEDKRIAAEVKRSKLEMQAQRAQTKRVRLKVRGDERALAARA